MVTISCCYQLRYYQALCINTSYISIPTINLYILAILSTDTIIINDYTIITIVPNGTISFIPWFSSCTNDAEPTINQH